MPLSMFADPTVAIEPPPQQSDFDFAEWMKLQAMVTDPFGSGVDQMIPASTTSTTSSSSKSWTDVFKDATQSFLKDFGLGVAGKVTGYNPGDPNQRAAVLAAQAAQQKAEQQKMFLIVGGVGLAVVLGALVMRKG